MKSKACCDDDNRSAAEQVPTPHAQYASLFSRSFLNSFLDLVLTTGLSRLKFTSHFFRRAGLFIGSLWKLTFLAELDLFVQPIAVQKTILLNYSNKKNHFNNCISSVDRYFSRDDRLLQFSRPRLTVSRFQPIILAEWLSQSSRPMISRETQNFVGRNWRHQDAAITSKWRSSIVVKSTLKFDFLRNGIYYMLMQYTEWFIK